MCFGVEISMQTCACACENGISNLLMNSHCCFPAPKAALQKQHLGIQNKALPLHDEMGSSC
jgi:hypothetical protein